MDWSTNITICTRYSGNINLCITIKLIVNLLYIQSNVTAVNQLSERTTSQHLSYTYHFLIRYNTSLPMDRCPKQEIEELRRMIIVDERGSAGGALKENVDVIFDKDFKVMSIRLVPLGLCAEQHTKTTRVQNTPVNADTKSQNTKSVSSDGYTEYLMTFVIPTVVIVCMILVAGIIACVLYRRRKTGNIPIILIYNFKCPLPRCSLQDRL